MFIPRHYEDPHTLHVGTMPNRAYFIPASTRTDTVGERRADSDRFTLLNGDWMFRYYASIYDLDAEVSRRHQAGLPAFHDRGFIDSLGVSDEPRPDELRAAGYSSIPVPSVWQNHGVDRHQYTNVNYPFPLDPPYVPQDNPCGVYLHTFEHRRDAAAPRSFLNFEGVDSCFYVWLNGVFVGYSQVSHATSEFDVTDVLADGANTLAVLVLKWCDGSYLEDQDKFRMSGIFRGCLLAGPPRRRDPRLCGGHRDRLARDSAGWCGAGGRPCDGAHRVRLPGRRDHAGDGDAAQRVQRDAGQGPSRADGCGGLPRSRAADRGRRRHRLCGFRFRCACDRHVHRRRPAPVERGDPVPVHGCDRDGRRGDCGSYRHPRDLDRGRCAAGEPAAGHAAWREPA